LINEDGSIQDRTTRGDRALWYHNSALAEIMVSMEYARAVNLTIPYTLETKLHKAVTLFLDGLDDHSIFANWAKERHNSKYDGMTQDWRDDWIESGNMYTGWLFMYPYYYPNHENTKRLRLRVPMHSTSANRDIDYGFGLGCLYNATAVARG
jgi:hypothetical protein